MRHYQSGVYFDGMLNIVRLSFQPCTKGAPRELIEGMEQLIEWEGYLPLIQHYNCILVCKIWMDNIWNVIVLLEYIICSILEHYNS